MTGKTLVAGVGNVFQKDDLWFRRLFVDKQPIVANTLAEIGKWLPDYQIFEAGDVIWQVGDILIGRRRVGSRYHL